MKISDNITELVGNTPLVRFKKYFEGISENIIGKLESFNPCSSVKDRIALFMIEDAEKKGILKEGVVIIEPTSGNTGIGLAFVAAQKGYKLILTMPESMSIERRKLLSLLGAEVVLTDPSLGMKGAVEKAEELHKQYDKSFMPQQFKNPANPKAHEKTTAIEILNDTEGQVDIVIAGVGTGGSITGIAKGLKEKNKNIKMIAVEPLQSAVLSGESPGKHKIQGIGAGFIPDVLDRKLIDEIIKIDENDALKVALDFPKKEGVLIGISAGAALFAASIIAKREGNKDKNIIVILPDSGERYLSMF